MTLVDAAVNGFLLAVGVFVVLVIGRLLVALANGDDPRDAAKLTGKWTGGLLGAAASVGAMGLVQVGDVLGMVTQFIGTHPFAASNFAIAGLGAAGLEGLVSLGPGQYLGIALGIVGLTMVVMEVSD